MSVASDRQIRHRGAFRAAESARRANRDRQRAWRARRKAHCAIFQVAAGEATISMLVRTGWLAEADACDPRKVGEVIGALLANTAKDFA